MASGNGVRHGPGPSKTTALGRQLRALSIKHARLASRDLKSTLAQLLTPVLVCLLLLFSQYLTNYILTAEDPAPALQPPVGRVRRRSRVFVVFPASSIADLVCALATGGALPSRCGCRRPSVDR